MVIVGGALAFTAISVFFLWRFILTCSALWRARKAGAGNQTLPANEGRTNHHRHTNRPRKEYAKGGKETRDP
jgi:hypothetical protein